MKRIILQSLIIATSTLMFHSTFASGAIQSAADGLRDHKQFLAHKNKLTWSNESDETTYLVVINYTNENIKATMPDAFRVLTRLTSAKFLESDGGFHKSYHIDLMTANGQVFWRGDMNPRDDHAPHDVISVYGAYPDYTVYDTP